MLHGDDSSVCLRIEARGGPGDEALELNATDLDDRVIGRASYARVYGPRALVTLEVDDGYWHRGLPMRLLETLCVAAACLGISTLLFQIPASDVRLLALLHETFAVRWTRDGAVVNAELATAGIGHGGAAALLGWMPGPETARGDA